MAVVHSLDDYTPVMLKTLPVLESTGVRATFFLTFTALSEQDLQKLDRAVRLGHELGSHTLSHPMFGHFHPEEFYTGILDHRELVHPARLICQHTSQPYVWSFAYPNGEGGRYPGVQAHFRAAGHIVGRGTLGGVEQVLIGVTYVVPRIVL